MRALLLPTVMVFTACGASPSSVAPPSTPPLATEPIAGACAAPERRAFDFWIGDWDTYDVAAPSVVIARNHVTPMVGGCALREVYQQNDGMRGESFTTYDAARRLWHQSWVTNRGALLVIEGAAQGDVITLEGDEALAAGGARRIRGAWKPEGDGVRETATVSTDGGKTWAPLFDIVFRRHRG